MSYIPIVPHVPQPEPSPRARRLAVELEETIERFEQEQGRLDGREVQDALGIVERSTTSEGTCSTAGPTLALIGAGLLGFLVLGLAFVRGALPMAGRAPIMIALVVGLLAAGAALVALKSRR